MKKLFTIKDAHCLWVESEGSVYSTFDFERNEHTFFNSDGGVLEDYSRPPIENEDSVKINDHDFVDEIGEGFYVYTTHEVIYDVDGPYGLFGIRHINGTQLTDEIYYQVGYFCNGLCAVSIEEDKWGCIDTEGNLIIPYQFSEEMFFNQYGVAVGNNSLIDKTGKEIPDTALNCIDECGAESRYFVFSFLNDEQLASIDERGTAPNITVNIYDTQKRKYVLKGIPECRLEVYAFDGEPEVILAAADLLDQYDSIRLTRTRTIFCEKDGYITVYDYES